MAINILVVDDDARSVTYMMKNLKRADDKGAIGTIIVDDKVTELDTLEKFDISKYDTTFDVALVDYQLTCSFTGILVSAWIALDLKIPRLTLTTAAYPGNPDYFNGFILKNEITDSPCDVIKRIIACVENYNSEAWLDKQHQAIVAQYQEILNEDASESQPQFSEIQTLLDRFERILDARQDEKIRGILMYENAASDFVKKQEENEKKIAELRGKLNRYLGEIKND